jgi:Uma2 family endonuclease
MSQPSAELAPDLKELINNLVTEDDEPVDNLFSAKQQRLLVDTLYASWTPPNSDETSPVAEAAEAAEAVEAAPAKRKFLADANVGIFYNAYEKPLVPDCFVSLDVQPHPNWHAKEHRSYLVWVFGKAPEVVVEIVSNRKGGELERKRREYARMGAIYYVVFDPFRVLGEQPLIVYEYGFGRRYRARRDTALPEVGLQLTLWPGTFEDFTDTWLRWSDAQGNLLPTSYELAAQAQAEAAQAQARAARLAEKLRSLGLDPDQL